MTAGVILAGGTSERLTEFGKPKQFVEVGGLPLIMYCIASFENCKDIDIIVIVAPKDRRGELKGLIEKYGAVKLHIFALPGMSRQHSICNALLALKSRNPDYVVIHDAARPILPSKDISECIAAAKASGYDGATPTLPVNETVYRSADGESITGLLNRDELRVGQTPECYDYAKYLQANMALDDDEIAAVRGSSEIAFRAGMKIHLYKGNPLNIKITALADLVGFKSAIEEHE